jgi:hypothetical protein
MSENETEKFETPPLPPQGPPPAPPAAAAEPEQPQKRWRDRRVGVVTLAVSTVAALFIGGTFGTAAGGLVGYGVGHHHRGPDGPNLVRMGYPGGMPERPDERQFMLPPNGELPPGLAPEQPEGSDGSDS